MVPNGCSLFARTMDYDSEGREQMDTHIRLRGLSRSTLVRRGAARPEAPARTQEVQLSGALQPEGICPESARGIAREFPLATFLERGRRRKDVPIRTKTGR